MQAVQDALAILKELGWLGAALVTIAAGIWVATTYLHSTRLAYQKSFNDKQLEIIFLTAETVGELFAARLPEDWEAHKERFWELYIGRLILFESSETAKAMVKLGNQLDNTAFDDRRKLRNRCLAVSRSLRNFLENRNNNDWRITFDNLVAKYGIEQSKVTNT
jgi:hypothetical protein